MDGKRFCSCCGKELDFFDLQNDFYVHKQIGYGSVYDGSELELCLCSECFDIVINSCVNTFKKSPIRSSAEVSECQ